MRRLVVLSLIAATLSGCTPSTNNSRGLAAVGGAAVVAGATVLIDGWSCDDRYAHDATCVHDGSELTTGAIVTAVGAALFAFGMYHLSVDPDDDAKPGATRTSAR